MVAAGGAGADAPPPVQALPLFEAASRHGAYAWAERRLFELTGSWAAAPGLPDAARVHLFEASAQHAWHADLWAARLPVLAGVDPDELVEPAGPGAPALFDALEIGALQGAPAGDETGTARRFLSALEGVVLPRLLASYRDLSRRLVPVTDGPSMRVLALVVADTESELAILGTDLAPGAAGTSAGTPGGTWGGTPGGQARADGAWVRSLAALADARGGGGLFAREAPDAGGAGTGDGGRREP